MPVSFDGGDEIKFDGLENFTKALNMKNPPVIHVGIIEDISRRQKGKKALTNAEIGAVHEYGAPAKGIPGRSWLRMPLIQKLQEVLESMGLLGEEALRKVLAAGTIRPWLEEAKIAAINTIKQGFFTQGWGKWPKWKKGYTNRTGMILQDTQQLRDHVDAEIAGE